MSESNEVVSDTPMRIVAGGHVAVLQANVPRTLPPALYEVAIAMGAKPTKAKAKRATPALESKPKTKRKRKPRQRSDAAIVTAAAKAIEKLSPEDYSPTGEPRMAALREEVPDLTPELRDKAWDLVVATAREKE